MLKKLSHKLILTYVALTVILVALIFILTGNLVKTTHVDIIKTEMSTYDELIDLVFRKLPVKPETSPALSALTRDLARIMELRITIIKPDGAVIADSEVNDVSHLDNHHFRKEVIEALESGSGYSTRYSSTLRTQMLYYAIYRDHFIIRLAKPLHDVDRSLSSLTGLIFKVSAIALIVSVIIIILVSIRITKPVNDTLDFAAGFAEGNYSSRILHYSNDEIGSLQKALNTMADRIVETINDHVLEQKKIEETFGSISDGIAMIDSSGQIMIYNKSFAEMLGIKTAIKEMSYRDATGNNSLNSRIEKSLLSGDKDIFDISITGERFLEVIITPISRDKTIQGILVVLHDISEKKKIERIKADLVSNVSHELKTPIAIVRGYLETIRENYSNEQLVMNYIERAIDNVDRQNALIQDIITLSMIESAREFKKENIDLKTIIGRCLELMAPKISRKEITVVNSLENNLDYGVSGNLFLAEEIFFNIIDNGINYNQDKGKLIITSSESEDTLHIRISDTGIGIPAEFQDRIFERFYRVDKSRSRATGGTGLGLSIVKHAAMVLSWGVTVNSDSSGTAFTVSVKK